MHWRNSNFGIKYFIANSCHTADEVYRKLCELKEERDVAIKNVNASILRQQAKIKKANSIIKNIMSKEWEVLEAQADLEEIKAFKEQGQACYEEALRERDFIQSLIDQIQPHRKYSHLPDYEAHQMAQQEEWKLELVFRAENFLMSQGSIPHDHLATMRAHPEFNSYILPNIDSVAKKLSLQRNAEMILLATDAPQNVKEEATKYLEENKEVVSNKTLDVLFKE